MTKKLVLLIIILSSIANFLKAELVCIIIDKHPVIIDIPVVFTAINDNDDDSSLKPRQ